MTFGFVSRDGVQLFYQKHGNGPVNIVFVHDTGMNSVVWKSQQDSLSDTEGNSPYTTIAVDMRGFGNSSKMGSLTVENHREDLRVVLEALKINKIILVGWGLGGLVAQSYALLYPEIVEKMVLVNTFPQILRDRHFPWGRTRQEELDLVGQVTNDFHSYSQTLSQNAVPENQLVRHKYKKLLRHSEDTILRQNIDVLSFSSLEDLRKIQTPALIIVGLKDQAVNPNCSFFIRQYLPNATLIEYPDAGHAPFLTYSDDFDLDLVDFIENSRDLPSQSESFLEAPLVYSTKQVWKPRVPQAPVDYYQEEDDLSIPRRPVRAPEDHPMNKVKQSIDIDPIYQYMKDLSSDELWDSITK